jgi:hypothetical protein
VSAHVWPTTPNRRSGWRVNRENVCGMLRPTYNEIAAEAGLFDSVCGRNGLGNQAQHGGSYGCFLDTDNDVGAVRCGAVRCGAVRCGAVR